MNSKKLLSMLLLSLGAFTLTYGAAKEVASVKADEAETNTYDVQFNVNNVKENICVFTDYAVNQTIAQTPENKSENPELVDSGRHSPVYGDGADYDCGLYYFAIDANGYICYASYGTGNGYGSPCDGYYHNFRKADGTIMDHKNDRGDMPIWSLHAEYNDWPNYTADGRAAWTLADFLVPEGGFVIKGYHLETSFRSFYNTLFDQVPYESERNSLFENTLVDGSLDNWYVYLDANRQLCVRQRTAAETQNEYGEQEVETPSKCFTTSAKDELVVYKAVKDVEELGAKAKVTNFKGLIAKRYGLEVWLQDENGKTIKAYGGALKDYAVGSTVSVTGYKINIDGEAVLSVTRVTNDLTGKFGAVEYNDAISATADTLTVDNKFSYVVVDEAEVVVASKGYTIAKVGEKEVYIKGAALTSDVVEGTKIKVQGFLDFENDIPVLTAPTVTPYHDVIIDNGLKGVKTVTDLTGNEIVVTPSLESVYTFVKWQIGHIDENGDLVYEDYSETRQLTITIEDEDIYLKAISEVDPTNIYIGEVNAWSIDADSPCTVWTKAGTKIHKSGSWGSNAWRSIAVVDAEGKVVYAVYNPESGYGGPMGQSYYTAPEYTSNYEANPAINILEGYGPWTPEDGSASGKFEIVVPEGGFAITTYQESWTDTYSDILWSLVSGNRVNTRSYSLNARHQEWANVRLVYDADAGKVSAFEVEGDPTADANCMINAISDKLPTIYDDRATEVVIPEGGDAYTIGIDADGKIIYGSYGLPMGFGGPGDGFYHDGSYSLVTGEVCGIFDVYSTWASWPNVTEDGKNAWDEYEIKVPEGGYIITGTREQMLPIINLLTGQNYTELSYWSNSVMEGLAKGSLNRFKVTVDEMTKVASVNFNAPSVTYSGSFEGELSYNASTGEFYGTVNLPIWNNIILTYTDAEGNATVLSYDTAKLSGAYTASDVLGADWTANLYHELSDGVDTASYGKFYCCVDGGINYYFTYNPTTKVLTALDADANVLKASVNEGAEVILGYADENGYAYGSFTLGIWNNVKVSYYDASHNATLVDYANYEGAIAASMGADWTDNLYCEEADTAKMYRCCNGDLTYSVRYNTADGKLYVSTDGTFPRLGLSPINFDSFATPAGEGNPGSYALYNGSYTQDGYTFTTKDVLAGTKYDQSVVQIKKNSGKITIADFDADTISVIIYTTYNQDEAGYLSMSVGGTELSYSVESVLAGYQDKGYDVYIHTCTYTVGDAAGELVISGSTKGAVYCTEIAFN